MNLTLGAGLFLIAVAVLIYTLRASGGAGANSAVGAGVVDMGDKEQKQRYFNATSVREIHRLLSDAAEKRIAGNRRRGLALRLEQAGSQMKPGEWVVMTVGTGIGAFLIVSLLLNVLVGILALIFGMLFQHLWLKRRLNKRQQAFGGQLAEALQLLAGSLRAGQSLAQALTNVANDAPSPSAEEYRRALTETRLGRDLTDALYAIAERMHSEDFEWVVGAIDINRTTGGDLAVILDRVTETIRQRDRLRGQVRTLSAEGRLSGWVVGLLPPGVFGFVYMTNREYMATFFQSPLGYLLLSGAGVLLVIGALWLRKIAKPIF
ncbi:MAG: type II secretion system F family protein [Acidimicrobiales bacterium]